MRTPTIIIIIHLIRVKVTDLIMVRAEIDNLEDLLHKIEDKDLNIVNVSFRITAIREAHCNKIIHNMVVHENRISKRTKQMHTEAEAGAGALNNLEDVPMAGRTSRIMLVLININTTHTNSNQNSMAHHAVCVEDSIIPPSIVIKGNTISITSWKR